GGSEDLLQTLILSGFLTIFVVKCRAQNFAPVRIRSRLFALARESYHDVSQKESLDQPGRLKGPSLGRRVHRSRGQAAAAHLRDEAGGRQLPCWRHRRTARR